VIRKKKIEKSDIKRSKSSSPREIEIKVCMGPASLASGGMEVLDVFERELNKYGLRSSVRKKCVNKTGCHGLCAKDVLVDVTCDSKVFTYQFVKPEMVNRIVEAHVLSARPVEEWLVGPDYYAFHKKQTKILLNQCGHIDPEDIDEYISIGGYKGAKKALSQDSFEVIEEIRASGLRGRGGAGFLTGLKWEFCYRTREDTKYIICNADEGDPGAFMDRAVIEGNPHSVIEGMIIGGYAIGAKQGYVYIRAEYPLAIKRLIIALEQAHKKKFLGRKILGSRFDFDIKIKEGAGAFICGEETALIASIEGERGLPRSKPPFPVIKGLWGKPTVINNVETLSNIPSIITKGASWYSSVGTRKSKGN